MKIKPPRLLKLIAAALVTFGTFSASARTDETPVSNSGKLLKSTTVAPIDNHLTPAPASFSFSDALGGTISPEGYLYTDYLITVSWSVAQSVTTTLTNFGGVANLSERLYAYGGSYLGDVAAPAGALQSWSTNYSLPGASVSIVDPTSLTAGQYVIELRGTSTGTFGGTLSISPVPEPESYTMLVAGLGLLGFTARRKGAAKA